MIVNATSVKGATNEVVLDSVVQEIDVATGLVEFQWDSLDHVPLAASYSGLPSKAHVANGIGNPFDYFHLNSIVPDKDGNLLVSARNTWAVYKVNCEHRGDHVDARAARARASSSDRAHRSRSSTTSRCRRSETSS